MIGYIGGHFRKKKRRKKFDRSGGAPTMGTMPLALRRSRAEGTTESPRTIALAKGGSVAPFVRRPGLPLGQPRRPARRLHDGLDVPAVSRIVLRPLNLR
jgi:hypothetical protein